MEIILWFNMLESMTILMLKRRNHNLFPFEMRGVQLEEDFRRLLLPFFEKNYETQRLGGVC